MNDLFFIQQLGYYISKNHNLTNPTPERQVKYYEIELYTTTGNKTVINKKEYPQKRGNILIVSPGDFRYSIDSFECYNIHFACNNSVVKEYIKTLPKVFPCYETNKLISIFEDMTYAYEFKKAGYDLYLNAKIYEIISLLVKNEANIYNGKYKQYAKNIYDACNYMETSFSENLTLSSIANHVNLSPSFFHKVFKDVMNETPINHLTKIRLSKAKELLKNTNLSLTEIALASGFNSQAYFNYVFKEEMNFTPKKYRTIEQNNIII